MRLQIALLFPFYLLVGVGFITRKVADDITEAPFRALVSTTDNIIWIGVFLTLIVEVLVVLIPRIVDSNPIRVLLGCITTLISIASLMLGMIMIDSRLPDASFYLILLGEGLSLCCNIIVCAYLIQSSRRYVVAPVSYSPGIGEAAMA